MTFTKEDILSNINVNKSFFKVHSGRENNKRQYANHFMLLFGEAGIYTIQSIKRLSRVLYSRMIPESVQVSICGISDSNTANSILLAMSFPLFSYLVLERYSMTMLRGYF